jgi:hypothetical protein
MTGKLVFPLSAEKRAQQEAQQRAQAQADAQKAVKSRRDSDARCAREAAQTEQRRRDEAQARREKARCDAIVNSSYAKDDPMFALELAYQTNTSSKDAIAMLRENSEAKCARSWKQSMARAQHRAWSDDSESTSSESSWVRSMRKAQGR